MSREEFLVELERLLSGISEEERSDALAFYRSYFEDAGEANEASILAELESPQKVADTILSNLGAEDAGDHTDAGERAKRREELPETDVMCADSTDAAGEKPAGGSHGEAGFDNPFEKTFGGSHGEAGFDNPFEKMSGGSENAAGNYDFEDGPGSGTGGFGTKGAGTYGGADSYGPGSGTGGFGTKGADSYGPGSGTGGFGYGGADSYGFGRESGSSCGYGGTYGRAGRADHSATAAAGVIIAVLTSPIWLSLLLAAMCVLLAVVATLFGLAVAVVAVVAALVFTGFVLCGTGISVLFGGNPAVGIGLTGAGLIILAIGLLAVLVMVWIIGVFLPWALRGLWRLCRAPFDRRKERAAV